MQYEAGMQIVFDMLTQMAVVEFRNTTTLLGPFNSQREANAAGEALCRRRGWQDTGQHQLRA